MVSPIHNAKEYFELWLPQVFQRYPGLATNLPGDVEIEICSASGEKARYQVAAELPRQPGSEHFLVRVAEDDLLSLLGGAELPGSACRAGRIEIQSDARVLSLDVQADFAALQRILPLFDGRLLSSTQRTWVWEGQAPLHDVRIFEVGNDELGFFATLTWALELIFWCRRQGLRPYFVFGGQCYRHREYEQNWFEAYFFHRLFHESELSFVREMVRAGSVIAVPDLLSLVAKPRNRAWSFAEAHTLFYESVGIREDVLCKVESFVSRHFSGQVLGVHYRGTDKTGPNASREAERSDFGEVFSMIDNILSSREIETIFVATDEMDFRNALQKRYQGKVSVCFHSALISESGGLPIHFDPRLNPHARGLEALLDSLILSRCGVVLKTPSYLSGWSKIFRPSADVYLVTNPNPDACWFPDALLQLYRPDS